MCKCKDNVVDIKFAKVRPTATIPSKRIEDAGYDIYADFSEDYMIINPNETKLIPTGIASAVSEDYYFQIQDRGSTGSKGMKYGAGVIDSGYRGEWFIPITNMGTKPIVLIKQASPFPQGYISTTETVIYPYEKAICQAVLLPVPKTTVTEISYEDLEKIPSLRGKGAKGSSNK